MSHLMRLKPGEEELMARFDSFFEAVGGVFAQIIAKGDIEAFDFFLRGLVVLGNCAKVQMERDFPHLGK
jgi:hypothetical protein